MNNLKPETWDLKPGTWKLELITGPTLFMPSPANLPYLLGVDGGNTKTIALVARADGTLLGEGRARCSDIYTDSDPNVPLAQAEHAINAALDRAGIAAADLAAAAFSMAGADWDEDKTLIRNAMHARGFGERIHVVNDSVGALWAGSPAGPAVACVCGTGANTAARNAEGRIWHSSWWQDVQGAHQLAHKVLMAVYRAELGMAPSTALTPAVLQHFNRENIEEIVYLFNSRNEPPEHSSVGSLSKVLFDVAQAGDPTAIQIATEHGAGLGDYVLAAARQVGIEHEPFTLVLGGGVLRHASRIMPEALIARVQSQSPHITPIYSIFEPAVGALLLAFETAGIELTGDILDRVTGTLPASSLFAT